MMPMMKAQQRQPPTVFFLLFALLLLSPAESQQNVCLIVYQMADNDLEYFLRIDNQELIQSPAIRQPTLTTWVYFDGRNIDPGFWNDLTLRNIYEPLEDVYYRDGSKTTTSFKGSSYMTWDHTTERMVVDTELPNEQNGDDPDTIQTYVTYALEDCIEKQGSKNTEVFVLFSSHGGGWGGFGGDEHARRRKLVAPNSGITQALQAALDNVEGAPDKYTVIGFDSCLMAAVGALDEYHALTDYFMASEATEPGHGWAYNYLDTVDGALAMAKDFHRDYLEQPQGKIHQTPKTLSIVDTSLFLVFLRAWEDLSAELTRLLKADDPFLLPILSRTRQLAISFLAYQDEGKQRTAVDIGSFLATFDALCQPTTDQLAALRETVVDAYYGMQVASGVGPGTVEATGVHIFWPTRRDFTDYPEFYTQALFEEPTFATQDAPNWLEFLKTFYAARTTTTGVDDTAESVCVGGNPSSITQPTREGQLLLNPTSEQVGGGFLVRSEVTRSTDEVEVKFGLDLTPALARREASSRGRRRLLIENSTPRQPLDDSIGSSSPHHPLVPTRRHRRMKQHRRLYDEDDVLFLFGGDVDGTYKGSEYQATWDGFFYVFFDESGEWEPAFATYLGSDSRGLPVMYFPPNRTVSGSDFPHRTTEEEAQALGGIFGYISIVASAEEGVLESGLTLYTQSRDTFSETPRSALGQIVPIIYAAASIGGEIYTVYVGGFNGTVFDWNEENEVGVRAQHWRSVLDENFDTLGLETVIVDITAFDFDKFDEETEAGIDYQAFFYPEQSGSSKGAYVLMSLSAISISWWAALI